MWIPLKGENAKEDREIKKTKNTEKNIKRDPDLKKREDPEKKKRRNMAENQDQNLQGEIALKKEETSLQNGIKTFINDLKVNAEY